MAEAETQLDYCESPAWQEARELVKRVYTMTANFPDSEQMGLTLRMRRAGVAVVSSIAESFGRKSKNPRLRSLEFARGASFELQTQLVLAGDLGFAYIVEEELGSVRKVIDLIDGLIENENADSK